MLTSLAPWEMAFAFSLALFAGVIKGVTGFAMPMILISGLGSVLAPELALAGLILPTLATNLWQAVRQGWSNALASAISHWRFLIISLICLIISAQFVSTIPKSVLFLILGCPVTLFGIIQLVGWRPTINPENRRAAEFGVATFAGTLGGLSGVWGPPTVMYLTALGIPKLESVRVQGVVYLTGSIALTAAHLRSGILDGNGLTFSAALVVPAAIGMIVGFWIQDRLDQERFRWAILCVLTVAGLNLIRRGLGA